MNPHRFSEQEIEGVFRAIRERRDMRHFQPDPIEPEQLARFIEAAHLAARRRCRKSNAGIVAVR